MHVDGVRKTYVQTSTGEKVLTIRGLRFEFRESMRGREQEVLDTRRKELESLMVKGIEGLFERVPDLLDGESLRQDNLTQKGMLQRLEKRVLPNTRNEDLRGRNARLRNFLHEAGCIGGFDSNGWNYSTTLHVALVNAIRFNPTDWNHHGTSTHDQTDDQLVTFVYDTQKVLAEQFDRTWVEFYPTAKHWIRRLKEVQVADLFFEQVMVPEGSPTPFQIGNKAIHVVGICPKCHEKPNRTA